VVEVLAAVRFTFMQPAPWFRGEQSLFVDGAEIDTEHTKFKVGDRVITEAQIVSVNVVDGGRSLEITVEVPDDDPISRLISGP
jgi:hypothetical protein